MPIKNFLNKMGLVEDDAPVAKTKSTQTQSQPTPTVTPAVSRMTTTYVPTPTVDPAIQDMLSKSLQDNKLSGFDYLKFISAVEESKSTGVSEDARFKMTFATAKQLGLDKNNLLQSGSHYLEVLDQDENDFNSDCSQYEKNEIQSRETIYIRSQNLLKTL